MVGAAAAHGDVPPRGCRRDRIGSGLDPVGDGRVLRAVEDVDPLDRDSGGARPPDLRAHRRQQTREVRHLRLPGRVEDAGRPARERRGEQGVLRAGNRDGLEVEVGPGEPTRLRVDITRVERHLRAELPEGREVKVDRPVTDRASAGKRYPDGASAATTRGMATVTDSGPVSIDAPMCARTFCIVRTSATRGRLVSRMGSAVRIVAAVMSLIVMLSVSPEFAPTWKSLS